MADNVRRIVAVFSAQNKAKGVMASFRRGLDSTGQAMKRMAKGVAVMGAVGTGVAIYMIKQQMEAIDVTAKLSDRIGIATEDLIGLQHAAGISGLSTETLNKSLEQFSKRLGEVRMGVGEARYALDGLGLSADELVDKSPAEAIGIIADRMNKLKTQADKVAAAQKLFGRSGIEMVNLLAQGSKGLSELQREAEKLGLTFSRIDAAQVEAANDALTRARATMTGLTRQATIELAPYIEVLANKFVGVATAGEGVGANVTNVFEAMSIGAISVGQSIQALGPKWKAFEAGVLEGAANILETYDKLTLMAWGPKKIIKGVTGFSLKDEAAELRQQADEIMESATVDIEGFYGQRSAVEQWFEDLRRKAAAGREAINARTEQLLTAPAGTEADTAAAEAASQALEKRNEQTENAINIGKRYLNTIDMEIETLKRAAAGHKYAAEMVRFENEIRQAGLEGTAFAARATEMYIIKLERLGKLKDEAADKERRQAEAIAARVSQQEAAEDAILNAVRERINAVRSMDYATRTERIQNLVAYVAANKESLDEVLEANKLLHDEIKALEQSKLHASKQWGRDASDIWLNLDRVAVNALDGMADTLTELTLKGRADFKALAQSVIYDITRMMIKMQMAQALGIGGGGLFGGIGGGVGVVGPDLPKVGTVTPEAGATLARYQHGGIATRPQLAMVGEVPEAFVPLSGGRSIPVEMRGGAGAERTTKIEIHNEGSEKLEINKAVEYLLSDQRIIEVTMQAMETHGPFRRGIKQVRS